MLLYSRSARGGVWTRVHMSTSTSPAVHAHHPPRWRTPMSPAKRRTSAQATVLAKVMADKAAADADRARNTTCPRCGAPTLTARAGRIAALDVHADPQPITPLDEIRHRLAGRLTWHLVASAIPGTPPRITWRHNTHITAGPSPHPVIADHTCKEGQ